MVKDPEDVGRDLASVVDENALYDEADSRNKSDLMPEALRSFQTQFDENQQGVQHELLETAFHDRLESRHTSRPAKDGVVKLAMDYTKDALHEYADFLIGDEVDVNHRDLPTGEEGYYNFDESIVSGFWSGKQDVLSRLDR